MDDTRPLDGLTSEIGHSRQIERLQPGENDLEGESGLAQQDGRRRSSDQQESTTRRRVAGVVIQSEESTPLVQTLDRMRSTGDAGSGTERVRRLRGQMHYRDDPTTAFHHRLSQAESLARAARDAGQADTSAIERKEDDSGAHQALERRQPD